MHLYEKYPEKNLIRASGKNQISDTENLKDFIIHVFMGGNPRDFRETILKKRVSFSNAGIFKLLSNLNSFSNDEYVNYITDDYNSCRNDDQRILPLWLGGITKKGLDNIARGDFNLFSNSLKEALDTIPQELEKKYGPLSGNILINGVNVEIDWNFFTRMSIPFYNQALSLKGSEKSASGKIWEKLLLGNILSIFGFEYLKEPNYNKSNSFWLSYEDTYEREVDATIIKDNKLIYIDIGFIGKGNPEISLDKVTRFKNHMELDEKKLDIHTIIIVDTIGSDSGIRDKANGYNAHILEMNSPLWTVTLCDTIRTILGSNTVIEFFNLINSNISPITHYPVEYFTCNFNNQPLIVSKNKIESQFFLSMIETFFKTKLSSNLLFDF